MNKTYLQRGFTLIELLVVIAIIGILSSVVLASLSTARNKASDTKVKEQLATVRTGAELFANANNNGYAASVMALPALPCTGGMFIDNASGLIAVTGTAGAWPNGTLLSCQATATAWAVSANLPSGGFWCVDSSGKSESRNANLGSGVVVCS